MTSTGRFFSALHLLCAVLMLHSRASWASDSDPPAIKDDLTARVRAYRVSHEKDIVAEFVSLLAIPNHAADIPHIRDNAAAILRLLHSRQIKASLIEAEAGPPVVFGELSAPGATMTVSFYAHYDGQPVDPRQWSTAPFTPTLMSDVAQNGGHLIEVSTVSGQFGPNWRLYARSASDDKAPIIGFMAALDALRALRVTPKVNLKFFFEGEEEIGSPHLAATLRAHRALFASDLWILCDGPQDQSGKAQIFFGARGVASLEITVYGPNHGLHSGHYGNWAPNPIVSLTHLLDSMRDENAHILIPDFYRDVRVATPQEKQAIAQALADDDHDIALKRALGIARTEGAPALLAEQILKPALNVHGIQGGHVGTDAANIIESEASASIDFRLVPNQTPEHVRHFVEKHIAQRGYWIVHEAPDEKTRREHARIARLTWAGGEYPGARTSVDLPISRSVVAVVDDALHSKAIVVPSLGGSIPMYVFEGTNAQPVIGVPIANYDNNQHTANENIRLQNLWTGIEIYAALFAHLGSPLQ